MLTSILSQVEKNEFTDYDELRDFVMKNLSIAMRFLSPAKFLEHCNSIETEEELRKEVERAIEIWASASYPAWLLEKLRDILKMATKEDILASLKDVVARLEGYGYPPANKKEKEKKEGGNDGSASLSEDPNQDGTKTTLNLIDVEIFRVGDYGQKGKYTSDDLKQIVENFYASKDTMKVPVTLGHSTAWSQSPAVGWVSELRIDEDKGILLADFTHVPTQVAEAIKAKGYRTVSVELYSDGINGLKPPVLRSVALVGAAIPEVKGLEDLKILYNAEGAKYVDIDPSVDGAGEKEAKKESRETDALKQRLYELETERLVSKFTEKLTPAQTEILKKLLLQVTPLCDAQTFSEGESPLDLIRKFVETLPDHIWLKEWGVVQSMSEDDREIAEIEKIKNEKGISFVEAYELWKSQTRR